MIDLTTIPTDLLQGELVRRARAGAHAHLASTALLAAAEVFHLTPEEITSHTRTPAHCEARFAIWAVLDDYGLSRERIAVAFDRLDVGTIRHGIIRARQLISSDTAFARSVLTLMGKFTLRITSTDH